MNNYKKAYIAGGCFWGMEDLFRTRPGIKYTEVGYQGGENENQLAESIQTIEAWIKVISKAAENYLSKVSQDPRHAYTGQDTCELIEESSRKLKEGGE